MSHLKEIYKSVQIWKSVIHLEGQSQLDGCYSMHLFSQILNLIMWDPIEDMQEELCDQTLTSYHSHFYISLYVFNIPNNVSKN